MSITLRAYNVLFGDALLVSWDEDDRVHHAWVDFGNMLGDANAVFEKVYADVKTRTNGQLDLLVVTHRHLDHLEGFHSLRKRFKEDFEITRLWHAHVTPQLDKVFTIAEVALRGLLPAAVAAGEGEIGGIWRNNFGTAAVSTKARMAAIVQDMGVPASRVFKIHRGLDLTNAMPPGLQRLGIEILAPEKDSKRYLQPLEHALRARGISLSARGTRSAKVRRDPFGGARAVKFDRSELRALADFGRLRRQLQSGGLDVLAAVDTTRNNTSIVMRWTHGAVTLLLTGDAEERSWEIMRANDAPFAARVVKVGHHGSINASPDWSFTKVMPKKLSGNAAVVSTDPTRFTGENEVPKNEVISGWRARLLQPSRLKRTDAATPGGSVAITVDG